MAGQDSYTSGAATSRSLPAVNQQIDQANSSDANTSGATSAMSSGAAASTAASQSAAAKKGNKSKKATDPHETGKLLAAKINQLELDAAGEKDQEAEIGTYAYDSVKSHLPCKLYKAHALRTLSLRFPLIDDGTLYNLFLTCCRTRGQKGKSRSYQPADWHGQHYA